MKKTGHSDLFFMFSLLFGRFPIWGLLLLTYFGMLTVSACISLVIFCIFGKGCLYAYENRRNITIGFFWSFWNYLLRPILFLVFVYVIYIAIFFAFTKGADLDKYLILGAFGFFIAIYALNRYIKKEELQIITIIERTLPLKVLLVLLWLYALISPDGGVSSLVSVAIIYILEFLSTYILAWKVDSDNSIFSGKEDNVINEISITDDTPLFI